MDAQADSNLVAKAITEVTARKCGGKVCSRCSGQPARDGVVCSQCHGSGIESKGGKDAAGTVELVTK